MRQTPVHIGRRGPIGLRLLAPLMLTGAVGLPTSLPALDLEEDILATLELDGMVIDAPTPEFDAESGVVTFTNGFVLKVEQKRRDGKKVITEKRHLVGEALRWNQRTDEFFAAGKVVVTMPLVRVECEQIGMRRLPLEEGEKSLFQIHMTAWNVVVDTAMEGRLRRIRAEEMEILPDRLILRGVHADGGHGGIIGLDANELVIGLKDERDFKRAGYKQVVEDVTVWHSKLTLAGAPVFYIPVIYRDFRLDYPWTTVDVGSSNRLGYYGRGEIGTDIPAVQGVDLNIRGRFDHYSRAGTGYGIGVDWQHQVLGRGGYVWYGMPHETVFLQKGWEQAYAAGPVGRNNLGRIVGSQFYADGNGRAPIITRSAHSMDLEHRFAIPGLTAYGRYTDIPDADPIAPNILDPVKLFATPEVVEPNERFRADYLREELESLPHARRGVAVAYSTPWVTTVLDSEFKHHEDLKETDRIFGAQATIPDISLWGPIHLGGDAWYEKLQKNEPEKRWAKGRWRESEANRLTYDVNASGAWWFGGLGLDATAGARGLYYAKGAKFRWQRQNWYDLTYGDWARYFDSRLGGTRVSREYGAVHEISREDVDGQNRWVRYGGTGMSMRMEGRWGEDGKYRHTITPRIGFDITSKYSGQQDDWVEFDFDDTRDELDEDERFLVTSLNTSFSKTKSKKNSLASMDLELRWGIRSKDREYRRTLSAPETVLVSRAISEVRRNLSSGIPDLNASLRTAGWPSAARSLLTSELRSDLINPYLDEFKDSFYIAEGPALAEVKGRIDLKPIKEFSFVGNFSYDNLEETWNQLALSAKFKPHRRIEFGYQANWLPSTSRENDDLVFLQSFLEEEVDENLVIETDDIISDTWSHRFNMKGKAGRYTLSTGVQMLPEGKTIDKWKVEIERKLVDGSIGLSFELIRDEDGRVSDQKWNLGVSLYGFDVSEF